MSDVRTAELRASLTALRDRIARAADAAGRDPAELTLIAITKTFPAQDAARLADLSVTDFGENRAAEAADKAAELPQLRWHFVGQVQRNKARSIAGFADWVHSVDRVPLVTALQNAASQHGRSLDVLLQVSLADDTADGRGGVPPAGLEELAAATEAADALRLRGLMAVAPLGVDPAAAFARLAGIAADFTAKRPAADVLSAGMSADLEAAVRFGATHLRIGTALLGGRPAIVR